jgi:hypothetical protein
MADIHLTDKLYERARSVASARGFDSVDEFLERVIEDECSSETENLDHLFTPKVLAEIDSRVADLDSGRSISIEEVEQRLAAKRQQWLSDRAS